jgi:hypothetical protein
MSHESAKDYTRLAVALTEMQRVYLDRTPHRRREELANDAMAVAMGILHGCCGPSPDQGLISK